MQEYSYTIVDNLLQNYLSVVDGSYSLPKTELNTSRDLFQAPFVRSVEIKADCDTAIDQLGNPGMWHKFTKVIHNVYDPPSYLTFKQQMVAQYIHDPMRSPPMNAITEICNYLNTGKHNDT